MSARAPESWPAPAGVRTEPGGVRAAFDALRMRAIVEPAADGSIRFEAWSDPRVAGSIVAALAAVAVYLVLDRYGASPFQSFVAVIVTGYYLPLLVVPAHRVSGAVAGGRVSVRVESKGVLAKPARVMEALRFYLA